MPLVRVFQFVLFLLLEVAISCLSFTALLIVIFCCMFPMNWFPMLGEMVDGDHETVLVGLGCGQGDREADRGLRRWL